MDRLEKVIEIMTDEYSKTCGECGEREECEGCKYWNVDCNLDYLIEVLLKWDKTIPKEKSIVLKNIDVSDKTFINQIEKVIEDGEELTKTVVNYVLGPVNRDVVCKEDTIKVFWEMVQTGMGLLQKIDVDADEVMEYYNKHLEKIKK